MENNFENQVKCLRQWQNAAAYVEELKQKYAWMNSLCGMWVPSLMYPEIVDIKTVYIESFESDVERLVLGGMRNGSLSMEVLNYFVDYQCDVIPSKIDGIVGYKNIINKLAEIWNEWIEENVVKKVSP